MWQKLHDKRAGALLDAFEAHLAEAPLSPHLMHEQEYFAQALATFEGHVGQAAASLGMSRPTFWRKRKRYGL